MIRIHRGDELACCPELPSEREAELARVEAAIAAGAEPGDELLRAAYRTARDPLYLAQHRKCCYCEAKFNSQRWHHVEHYRPKRHYWWLTWTWANLLFACHDCNNAKHDSFPLGEAGTRLRPGQQPPGEERPLLIDPAAEDPREHIRFVPRGADGPWFPVDRTERGREMLKVLGWIDADAMVQDGLVERWRDHVDSLREVLRTLQRAFASRDPARIHAAWTEHTRRRRRASQPFVALTLDVLEWYFGPEIERWQLPLTILRDL